MKIIPLGIEPKFLWVERRLRALNEAIDRYDREGWEPLPEWFAERAQHIEYLRER